MQLVEIRDIPANTIQLINNHPLYDISLNIVNMLLQFWVVRILAAKSFILVDFRTMPTNSLAIINLCFYRNTIFLVNALSCINRVKPCNSCYKKVPPTCFIKSRNRIAHYQVLCTHFFDLCP